MSRFRELSRELLRTDLTPGERWDATHGLFDLLFATAGFEGREIEPDVTGETRLKYGNAISPLDAARCLLDLHRTHAFATGLAAAIQSKRTADNTRPVHVLYAGCGPFASLALPAMTMFSAEELQFTMLDLHAESTRAFSQIADAYRLTPFIRSLEVADATTYRLPQDVAVDVILIESMHRGLTKEAQVAIAMNLVGQAHDDVVVLPEKVELHACHAELGANEVGPAGSIFRLGSEPTFVLSRDAVRRWPEWDADAPIDTLPAESVTVPRSREPGERLAVATRIKVYENIWIEDYQSGLTHPDVFFRPPEINAGDEIQWIYNLKRPGLQVARVSAGTDTNRSQEITVPVYKWQPTTADIALRADIPAERVVRFDHNTSPFTTEWALDLVAESSRGLNEYPGADYRPIREAAAQFTGVDAANIVPGAGVDELILLCGQAFLRPGSAAVVITPTYPLYRIATGHRGAGLVDVPSRGPDFDFPIDEVLDAARDADLTWVCSPNNPTGNAITEEQLSAVIAATDGVVVVDAAYAEFAAGDWARSVDRYHNLIVLRTLSKAFGIAGARVGYAMSHPSLAAKLDAVRPPGSISSLSLDVGVGALARVASMQANVAEIVRVREELAESLKALGFRVLPSQTNFLLCEVGPAAMALEEGLMTEGLVVRAYPGSKALSEYLRFTVRHPDENARLLEALARHMG